MGYDEFQSAGRIWGFWNSRDSLGSPSPRCCFNPPGGFGAFGTERRAVGIEQNEQVSIRRADLGLLEPRSARRYPPPRAFQSAGRIWGFWNLLRFMAPTSGVVRFQSAGRIWGFWNMVASWNVDEERIESQSAGRIWGFWN
ncbi:hypothetical protein OSCT_0315 [Oscillochloris trichoides DG-6]|uniref:Uncharacterized protein n=1 Tax=Oscillochloris trichoides DG-6 TaxID=765420 RepID=E1IAG4_9CHLR|nr:hypothetical protein OSCT_0315 [Oscillochloris trichoides DG-6]